MPPEPRRITLIRHGAVAGPAALYGRTDIALSTEGEESLHRTLAALHQQLPITQLVSSPLRRCALVAQAFANATSLPLWLDDAWREMDFGRWDGVPFDDLGSEWPQLEAFWQYPARACPPAGEPLAALADRVRRGWEHLVQAGFSHTAVICHGGVIKTLLAQLLEVDWRNPSWYTQLRIDYHSYTLVELPAQGRAKICGINLPADIRR